MEQLWYTWSTNGPKSGFQIRATSPGLREEDERTDKLLPYVGYRLPEGTYDTDPKYAPISLSLTATSYGRILLRKVYKLDGAGRPGAFFSHLVLLNEASERYTIREAIDLWTSGFWRESENDSDPRILPQVGIADLTPSPTSPFEQFDISKRTALTTLLSLVLLAFLTHQNRRRFYILAPSQVVTAIIWGLAHSLPRTLTWWEEITFTTYDDDVSKATECIVGTFRFPTSSSQDLPDFCYTGNVMAINVDPESFVLRKHFLPDLSTNLLNVDFTEYAAKSLVNCNMQDLSALVRDAEHLGINNIPQFVAMYEKEIIGKSLTLEQIIPALGQKTPDEKQLSKPKNQNIFVTAIADIASYWEGGARAALAAFCRRAEHDQEAANIRSSLTEKVVIAIGAATQGKNAMALARLLQALVELAPATKNMAIWRGQLRDLTSMVVPFAPVASSTLFPWETRFLLFSQWVQIINPSEEKIIHVWLKVAWNDLGELLSHIPREWHRLVLALRLEEIAPIPLNAMTIVATIVQQYAESLLKPTLQEFVQGSEQQAWAAVYFINQLVVNKYPMRLELLLSVLMADKSGKATQHLNSTLSLQRDDLFDFVETYLPHLIQYSYFPHAAEFVKNYIDRYFELHSSTELVNRSLSILNLIYRLNDELQRTINNPQAGAILAVLTKKVVNALQKMVQERGSKSFFQLLEVLQLLAPAGMNSLTTKVWQELLGFLPNPGQQFPWATRELLLLQWASIAIHVRGNDISKWLDVQWSDLGRLLALPMPDEWRFLAIEKRIEDSAPLPSEARTVVEQYADGLVAQVLELHVVNGSKEQVGATVRFVEQLLKQKYSMRLNLLLRILIVDEIGHATSQLTEVNPEDDLFEFVENYLGSLMPYTMRRHTAMFAQIYIDHYFADLPPSDLVNYQPTRNLLHGLSQILSLHLPDELQARIRCWQEIARFLELGSAAANLGEVEAFTSALARGGLSPKTCRQLNDTLAPVLASHDFDEEELELVKIVYLMGKALIGSPPLLESMAIVAGEQYGASPRNVFPYIMLVLHDAYELTGTTKEQFLGHSLNHLLKQIGSRDERAFREIERRVKDLPKRDITEWEGYLSESRFAPVQAIKPPTMPWYYFFRRYYWKSRPARKKLREALRGRMATKVAHDYNPLLDNDEYLTVDEKALVSAARAFTDAYETNNDELLVHLYQDIWGVYQGKLYFKPEELKRIREAEKKLMARGNAG